MMTRLEHMRSRNVFNKKSIISEQRRTMSCPHASGTPPSMADEDNAETCYHDYLHLDKILSSQHPKSQEPGNVPAHDELLFIITHQTHELWFKEIMHEINTCITAFRVEYIQDDVLLPVLSRLKRVVEILKVLISQLKILETMSALDFLDFRDLLSPASGFQSKQFRLLENSLGLRSTSRLHHSGKDYSEFLKESQREEVKTAESNPTLHSVVESWLERTPYLKTDEFDFWVEFEKVYRSTMGDDVDPETLKDMDRRYQSLFDEKVHSKLVDEGKRSLSAKAWRSALFIFLYRDSPALQMPYQVLNSLMDIESQLTSWRIAHYQLVHRMLGVKVGTGGSSGYQYLKATASYHHIFQDLMSISAYMLPRSNLPVLPDSMIPRFRGNTK